MSKFTKITFHRDRTVTFWNVYSQRWERKGTLSDEELASLPEEKRTRVLRHTYDRSKERF
jgi:hypothetical protein